MSLLENPNSFAVVGCQRSGTHMLREVLNSNPHIAVVSEPITHNPDPYTWHTFLDSLPQAEMLPLNDAEAALLFDRYMENIRHKVGATPEPFGGRKTDPIWVGLDIKYNQLNSINIQFRDLCAPPFLIKYVVSHGFRIVHLIRRNVLHQAVSLVVANLRNVWRNMDNSTIEGAYILPTRQVLGYMQWIESERREFVALTKAQDVLSCYYEDVVDDIAQIDGDGYFPTDAKALAPIAEFLGVPNRFHYNDCRPKVLNRPYREFIENYDELVSAVRDSDFSHFADTI